MPHFIELAQAVTQGAFARRGAWEEAWRFSRAECPSELAITRYIDGADEVAFEIFCGRAFFGLRVSDTHSNVARFALLARECFADATDGFSFVDQMRRAGYLSRLAGIRYLEVGAVFAWRSVGAFRLPNARLALATWDEWWPALLLHPVSRNDTHAKAIEFAFDEHTPHWYGVPVATEQYPNLLSESGLRRALEANHNEI